MEKIVDEAKLKEEGCYFENGQYGNSIFLMNPGMDISPSFMGLKSCPGMHGYDPDDKDTFASILSNRELPENLKNIHEIFWLIMNEAGIKVNDHPMPFKLSSNNILSSSYEEE